MRWTKGAAVAASLVVVPALAGCVHEAPEIPETQVQQWRDLAADSIPRAAAVEVMADQVVTMAASYNVVYVTVSFATFADLQAGDQAVTSLEDLIETQVPDADVITTVINQADAAIEAEVAARLLEAAPHLAGVTASASEFNVGTGSVPELRVTVYAYVTDPDAIDPQWLDSVVGIAGPVASEAGGRLDAIAVLPASAVGTDLGAIDWEADGVDISELPAFPELAGGKGCVTTDAWAYDVVDSWVLVYPADAPAGECLDSNPRT